MTLLILKNITLTLKIDMYDQWMQAVCLSSDKFSTLNVFAMALRFFFVVFFLIDFKKVHITSYIFAIFPRFPMSWR